MSTLLKSWREKAQIGIEAAACEAQVSAPTWSRWENGRRRIPAARALRIEELTGISRHDLRPDVFGPSHGGAS